MDSEAIAKMIGAVDTQLGRIDILFNNTGGVLPREFLKQSERSRRRHIDLNLISMLAATSAAVPIMIGSKQGGAIVNITSIKGSRAAPNFAVYAAAFKAGMIGSPRPWPWNCRQKGYP